MRIYVEDKPYDIVETTMGPLGIELFGCPLPPKADVNEEIFTLANLPIELEEGTNIKAKIINISGADISPSAGTSLVAKVLMVAEKTLL